MGFLAGKGYGDVPFTVTVYDFVYLRQDGAPDRANAWSRGTKGSECFERARLQRLRKKASSRAKAPKFIPQGLKAMLILQHLWPG
jgi:hypothetical protein